MEEHYLQYLSMHQRLYGEDVDHVSIARALHSISAVSLESDNLENAEQYFKQSLSIYQRLLGNDVAHSSLARTLFSLGELAEKKQTG